MCNRLPRIGLARARKTSLLEQIFEAEGAEAQFRVALENRRNNIQESTEQDALVTV